MLEKIKATTAYLNERIGEQAEIGIILGTGLGGLVNEIEDAIIFPYEEIPHFPVSTVHGHSGRLIYGRINGKKVIAMQGRFRLLFPMQVVGCARNFKLAT